MHGTLLAPGTFVRTTTCKFFGRHINQHKHNSHGHHKQLLVQIIAISTSGSRRTLAHKRGDETSADVQKFRCPLHITKYAWIGKTYRCFAVEILILLVYSAFCRINYARNCGGHTDSNQSSISNLMYL